jgi:hypothetical protein
MRTVGCGRGAPRLALGLALAASLSDGARADGLRYATQGHVWGQPAGAVQFQGVDGGTIPGTQPFPLGDFRLSVAPGSTPATIDAPFNLRIDFPDPSAMPLAPREVPIRSLIVSGLVVGTTAGALATVTSVEPDQVIGLPECPHHRGSWALPFNPHDLVVEAPARLEPGTDVTLMARMVPEPTPTLPLALLLGALVLRGRLRRRGPYFSR